MAFDGTQLDVYLGVAWENPLGLVGGNYKNPKSNIFDLIFKLFSLFWESGTPKFEIFNSEFWIFGYNFKISIEFLKIPAFFSLDFGFLMYSRMDLLKVAQQHRDGMCRLMEKMLHDFRSGNFIEFP